MKPTIIAIYNQNKKIRKFILYVQYITKFFALVHYQIMVLKYGLHHILAIK